MDFVRDMTAVILGVLFLLTLAFSRGDLSCQEGRLSMGYRIFTGDRHTGTYYEALDGDLSICGMVGIRTFTGKGYHYTRY